MERLQEKGWMAGGGEGGRMGVGRGREEMGKGKDDFWRRFFLGHADGSGTNSCPRVALRYSDPRCPRQIPEDKHHTIHCRRLLTADGGGASLA